MKIQEFIPGKEGWRPSIAEVAEFLNTRMLGTLATVASDGRPQVARVAFSQNERLELVIGTADDSRKALNIGADPRVAFEVTDEDRRLTVQFEGRARVLASKEFEKYSGTHFEKLPASLPFKDIKGQVYILLEPVWVRFSDCNPHPWAVTEFTF